MRKNIIISVLLVIGSIFSSCRDQFGAINTDPEKTDSEFNYLFTAGLLEMNMHEYFAWYWNYRVLMPWTQTVASSGGNTDQIAIMSELHETFNNMVKVKVQVEAIKRKRKALPADEAAIYAHLEAMCAPVVVFMGLQATDGSGSIPYSEAGLAYFEGESAFRPKFDSQKELFNQWLAELKESVIVLNNPVTNSAGANVSQLILGSQDFVYNGNSEKWAKFANSLRLKIAVRLLHQDRALAVETLKDVLKYPLIDVPADDFIWNPGSQWINTGEGLNLSTGGIQIVDFLVKNKDPRVRFFFYKNQFNEQIVNGFLQAGKRLPSYIDKYVEQETDAEGKKRFTGWKEPGEPWVRYHGVPIDTQSKEYPEFMADYYIAANFDLGTGDQRKGFSATSGHNETMFRGGYSFNYPSLPGVSPKLDDQQKAIHYAYMSAAEVNLYLAEFKLLEPTVVTGDASTYYKKGIEYSVLMYDHLASRNRIPYYFESTDLPTDVTINLKNNEISTLLSQPDYQLVGSKDEQLERIYIQQYLHFTMYPLDLYSTMRRTGVPIRGSSYYPLLTWNSKSSTPFIIPRRFIVKSLAVSDELYESRVAALQEQGFTPGKNDPATLSNERLWLDKGAPGFGEGPKY